MNMCVLKAGPEAVGPKWRKFLEYWGPGQSALSTSFVSSEMA